VKKQLDTLTDLTGVHESEIKRIRSVRQLQKPTADIAGFVFKIEWVQRDQYEVKAPSLVTYEELKRVAPRIINNYFIKKTILVPKNREREEL